MAKVQVANVKTAEVTKVGTVGEITTVEGVKNVGFKVWWAPQVDDRGIKASARWKEAAAMGVAIINTMMAIKIAKLQWEIAAKYRDMFMQDHNRYMTKYSPREKEYMISVGEVPPYREKYKERSEKYRRFHNLNSGLTDAWMNMVRGQVPMCVDPSLSASRDLYRDSLQVTADDTAFTQENYEKIRQDDNRFRRRSDALDRGRSLVVTSADFASRATNMYGQLGKTIGTAAEGAAGALGYFGARNNTSLPTGVTSYDAVDSPAGGPDQSYGNIQSVGGLTNPRSNSQQV